MYKLNPNLILRKEFDNSAVLFDADTGKAYMLSPTSARIVELIQRVATHEELLAELDKEIDLPTQAPEEIMAFIHQLENQKFICKI